MSPAHTKSKREESDSCTVLCLTCCHVWSIAVHKYGVGKVLFEATPGTDDKYNVKKSALSSLNWARTSMGHLTSAIKQMREQA